MGDVEWMSFRIEAPEAPTDADRDRYRAALEAGMKAIREVLGVGNSAVTATLTVYPLTHDEDVANRRKP